MSKKVDADSSCAPPGSARDTGRADHTERACALCGRKMYFAEDFRVHVCLNKDHGALAYYSMDDCYFTSQKAVAVRFAKEGKKFHIIEPEILRMIGVES
jgi:hypothetical protein